MNLSFITEGLLFHLRHLQEGLPFLTRTVKPTVGASDLKQTKHGVNSIVFRDRRLNVACPFLHHVLSSCGVFGSGFNPSGYCLLVLNSQIVRVYFGKCFFSFGGGEGGRGCAN